MTTTVPFFIVSSGRSGTQMMERLLGGLGEVEIHHEYLCTHVQPLAVRRYMGLASHGEVVDALRAWHGAAVHYCPKPLFGDSSNKLSWVIDALEEVFPNARYIHLIRDGRKVASSYLHKLGDECYDDRSTEILARWCQDPERHPCPPPEKKYWWPLPRAGSPWVDEFSGFDQFERISFHWAEINREIERQLEAVPAERRYRVRLEDLVTDEARLREMIEFLGLEYRPDFFECMQRPHNVNVPRNFSLSDAQLQSFERIAGDMLRHYGYHERELYEVRYDAMGGEKG